MIIRFLLLLSFTRLCRNQNLSPCPETFSYEPRGTESDRWYGVIALRTAEDLTGIWLHIGLDNPAELLGNWFGESSSSDNIDFSIHNSKYKLEAGPPVAIRFFVKYNPVKKIPSLKTIRLNGKTICSNQLPEDELRPTLPTLHISHSQPTETSNSNRPSTSNGGNSVRPGSNSRPSSEAAIINRDPDVIGTITKPINRPTARPTNSNSGDPAIWNSSKNQGNPNRPSDNTNSGSNSLSVNTNDNDSESDLDFFPGDFVNILKPAESKPSRPTHVSSRSPACGIISNFRPSPLIAFGQDTTPGQWPWHVALYYSKGIQLTYTCGATLISDQHILTAAHCVTKPHTNRIIDASSLLVYLGKYNLVSFGPEVQERDVDTIYVHPQYNYSVYYNDIAVVKLTRSVEITNFVRPCCLWEDDSELENIIEQQGTVVGWGFDENKKLSNKLMQAQMPVVSTIKCIYSNREFFSQITFEKNYCAGFRNGTSVCNGDSGGGMVFPKKGTSGQNTVWQIRGLVSVGVALQGQAICDTSQYIVFTDVAKHVPWIKQITAS